MLDLKILKYFYNIDQIDTSSETLLKGAIATKNLRLIKKCLSKKPIIISTGMSSLGQVEEAVNTVREAGNTKLMLLHCNSSYPAAPEEMNLNAINTLKKTFQVPVGLSDHTFGLMISHSALTLGANLIERHFTLDRSMQGPDHILSSEPDEMIQLVQLAKIMPKILGDGIKKIQPNEYVTLNAQRRSIYSKCFIKKDEIIIENKIIIKSIKPIIDIKSINELLQSTVWKIGNQIESARGICSFFPKAIKKKFI